MWSCTPYGSISIRPCDYSLAEFFSHFSICRSLMSLLHYLAFANMQKWGVELNFPPFTLHSGPQRLSRPWFLLPVIALHHNLVDGIFAVTTFQKMGKAHPPTMMHQNLGQDAPLVLEPSLWAYVRCQTEMCLWKLSSLWKCSSPNDSRLTLWLNLGLLPNVMLPNYCNPIDWFHSITWKGTCRVFFVPGACPIVLLRTRDGHLILSYSRNSKGASLSKQMVVNFITMAYRYAGHAHIMTYHTTKVFLR